MSSTKTPSRNTFAFYWSFKDAIRDMSDADKLAIYESITDFAFFGIEPDGLSPIGSLAWKLMRPQLEASIRRYEACIENGKKGAEFGKLGGRPRKNNPNTETPKKTPDDNPKGNPLNHNHNDNDNQNEKEKGVIGGDSNKRTPFVAPSLEELRTFVTEKNLTGVNPEEFINHYMANGWRAGKNPMRNWKAAAQNWNLRASKFNNQQAKPQGYETKRVFNDL